MKKTLFIIFASLILAGIMFSAGCKKAEEPAKHSQTSTQAQPSDSAPTPEPVPTKTPAPAQKPAVPIQKQQKPEELAYKPKQKAAPVTAEKPKSVETRAIIETKFGNIELMFFPGSAPNHVKNFIGLAKKGVYDGTTFHRVIPGFMIQGGDPNSKDPNRAKHGTGGPGYTVKAEFNDRPHKRGTLSMARAMDPDSAGSQFFICVVDASFLDNKYTVFGEVISGMEVVDKIVKQPRDNRDNPFDTIEMKVNIIEK